MNNINKRFIILTYIQLTAVLFFAILNLSFSFDISILAFPLSICFGLLLIYFSIFKMLKNLDGKYLPTVLKMSEYLPYFLLLTFIFRRAGKNGTAEVIDVFQVILWCIVEITTIIITRMLNEKHSKNLTKDWKTQPIYKKYKGIQKVIYEVFDWVDAIVWAVFTVLLIQIFVFQLYEIPSESMVPTFLVKDKVVVSKIDCGPKFPLTNVGLPDFRKYKKGDTIVLRNPHYRLDRKSEVKTVISQLVYMLTFMQVNLNKDENGELKADPLVKRITALPGEQIVMQDGVLYYRTKDHDFIPSEKDEKYAAWNLNKLNKKTRDKVQYIPFNQDEYEKMLAFEEERRNFDLNIAEFQAKELVIKMNQKLSINNQTKDSFKVKSLSEYYLFSEVPSIAKDIITKNGGGTWFEEFMLSWIDSKNIQKDLYEEANYKLNVMTKITFGNLLLRYVELMNSSNIESNYSDSILLNNYDKAETLNWYIQLLDERNLPVFPANDKEGNPQYIPENCYFMMGDNRFNSLDLRHSMNQALRSLSVYDKMSIEYYSMIEPQYIHKKYIIGKPVYRFLPSTRRGKV